MTYKLTDKVFTTKWAQDVKNAVELTSIQCHHVASQQISDVVMSAMPTPAIILHQRSHRYVTIATTEISNVLLRLLVECRPGGVTLTSM